MLKIKQKLCYSWTTEVKHVVGQVIRNEKKQHSLHFVSLKSAIPQFRMKLREYKIMNKELLSLFRIVFNS